MSHGRVNKCIERNVKCEGITQHSLLMSQRSCKMKGPALTGVFPLQLYYLHPFPIYYPHPSMHINLKYGPDL